MNLRAVGEPTPLPPGLDLSAYRIVQEGLTNSLKHSGGAEADVTVDTARTGCGSRCATGEGTGRAPGDGSGHGLVGIRERVKIFGGEMSAGPAPGGGFLVRARLPVGGEVP